MEWLATVGNCLTPLLFKPSASFRFLFCAVLFGIDINRKSAMRAIRDIANMFC